MLLRKAKASRLTRKVYQFFCWFALIQKGVYVVLGVEGERKGCRVLGTGSRVQRDWAHVTMMITSSQGTDLLRRLSVCLHHLSVTRQGPSVAVDEGLVART